jgi:hypothetical protein
MTIACGTIQVSAPPSSITATNMTLSQTTCVEPCDVTATITWRNNGGAGSFEPAIVVNGTRTGLGSNINLARNATTTQTFNLTGLTTNTYTVCPDPN